MQKQKRARSGKSPFQRQSARIARLEAKVRETDRLAAIGLKQLADRILDLEEDLFEEGPEDEGSSRDAC